MILTSVLIQFLNWLGCEAARWKTSLDFSPECPSAPLEAIQTVHAHQVTAYHWVPDHLGAGHAESQAKMPMS